MALGIVPPERLSMLSLALLILLGGLFPQPGIISRYYAAEEILAVRKANLKDAEDDEAEDFFHAPHEDHDDDPDEDEKASWLDFKTD